LSAIEIHQTFLNLFAWLHFGRVLVRWFLASSICPAGTFCIFSSEIRGFGELGDSGIRASGDPAIHRFHFGGPRTLSTTSAVSLHRVLARHPLFLISIRSVNMQICQLRGKGATKIPKKCSDLTREHAMWNRGSFIAKRHTMSIIHI